MTRTLLLLRHAKAAESSESGTDFDRPLAKRGLRNAEAITSYMQSKKLKPDLVWCSSAKRTLQTAAAVLSAWPNLKVNYTEQLYLASLEQGLSLLRESDTAATVLLVGHNPMIEQTLHMLVDQLGKNDQAALLDASEKYPTGALAELRLDIDEWVDLKPSCGRLKRFIKPRTLV